MKREVVEFRHVPRGSIGMARIWETSRRIPQLIEERMDHSINCRQSLGWSILQELRDQIDRIRIGLPEHLEFCELDSVSNLRLCRAYLTERMRLDLREFVLHVVGVHGANLVSGRSAEDFDDLHKLINA